MTVLDFFKTVVESLGDGKPGAEFRRYPLRSVLAAYNEALCFVATLRRDLFTRMVIMKLVPGITQDAKCCGCKDITGIMAQVLEDGTLVKDLSKASAVSYQTVGWYRVPCPPSEPRIQSVGFEAGLTGVFSVYPPVPTAADMWVRIKCVTSPHQLIEADLYGGTSPIDESPIPPASIKWCSFQPAVRSYMLARLLVGDRHAVGASADSARELKHAYDFLGVQYKMEQALAREN